MCVTVSATVYVSRVFNNFILTKTIVPITLSLCVPSNFLYNMSYVTKNVL